MSIASLFLLDNVDERLYIDSDNHYQYKGMSMGPRHGRGHFGGRGQRMTASRNAILAVLSQASGYLSAEEIYVRAQSVHPDIGIASVYRNLENLTVMGALRKIVLDDKKARYELAKSRSNRQGHLICTHCRSIVDISEEISKETSILEDVDSKLVAPNNFKAAEFRLQIFGVCKNCQQHISP